MLLVGLQDTYPPPPVEYQLMRFPPPKVIAEWQHAREEHKRWCQFQAEFWPADAMFFGGWLIELRETEFVYETLQAAQCVDNAGGCRQDRLDDLRYLLGERAWSSGTLPPPIPEHQARTRWR